MRNVAIHRLGFGTMCLLLALALAGCPLGHGSKKIGEKCTANNDCAEVHCLASMCVKACKTDNDCAEAAVKMTCTGNVKSETNPEAYGLCSAAP